jgi:hypothetical protein
MARAQHVDELDVPGHFMKVGLLNDLDRVIG